MSPWILRMGAADARLLVALAHRRGARLSRFFRVWTHLGDAPVPILFTAALLAGWIPGWQHLGLKTVLTLTLAFALSQVLKRTISRPRPRLPEGLPCLVQAPDRFSFPSGHATASLAVALPVVLELGMGLGSFVLLPLVLLVGVSRCYLGVHYPGDVLSGWGLALLSMGLVTQGLG
jgi:undecaprenyl-diphosphatase